MTKSSPGFVGGRLTEARKARGISGVDLAEILGVTPQSVSRYENGHQSPKHDVFLKLCGVLRFPQAFFLKPCIEDDVHPVFWRGKLSAPVNMQERSEVRLRWMKETVDYLARFFDFPSRNIPSIDMGELGSIGLDDLEGVANSIREHLEIRPGPIPDVIEKLEANGVLISRIHVRAEKLDSFSQWSDKYQIPFMLLGRDKSSAVRQRFDALHELVHLVVHRNLTQKDLNKKATYKLVESHADKIASCLLLPEREFIEELYAPSLDGFLMLKERWGASVGAMIMRCRGLDLIGENEARRMWINYSRRGWRKSEPLDNKMRKEEPHLIRRSFELLLSEGVQSVADIKMALPFPIHDFEEITDVEPGTFGDASENRIGPEFKDSVKAESNVVQFLKN